jgi:hypothetical protein
MMMVMPLVGRRPLPQLQQQQQQQQQQQEPVDNSNKMTWGQPTWTLLHTLAHKVKDFAQIRTELLDIVMRVCTNLPCPMCANHAAEYLNKINFAAIQTQKDLKDMLFQFHNSVNVRKAVPQLSYAELDAKYDAAITAKVIQQFLFVFQGNAGAQISVNTFSKNRALQFFQGWFRANLPNFDS